VAEGSVIYHLWALGGLARQGLWRRVHRAPQSVHEGMCGQKRTEVDSRCLCFKKNAISKAKD